MVESRIFANDIMINNDTERSSSWNDIEIDVNFSFLAVEMRLISISLKLLEKNILNVFFHDMSKYYNNLFTILQNINKNYIFSPTFE